MARHPNVARPTRIPANGIPAALPRLGPLRLHRRRVLRRPRASPSLRAVPSAPRRTIEQCAGRRPTRSSGCSRALMAIAIVAAALAPDQRARARPRTGTPSTARRSRSFVLALVYLLGSRRLDGLARAGLPRIELPGGAALERDTAELVAATTEIDSYREFVTEQVDGLRSRRRGDRPRGRARGRFDARIQGRMIAMAIAAQHDPSPPLVPISRARRRCVSRRSPLREWPSSSTCAGRGAAARSRAQRGRASPARRASRRRARRRACAARSPKRTVSGPPNGWRSTTSSSSPSRTPRSSR